MDTEPRVHELFQRLQHALDPAPATTATSDEADPESKRAAVAAGEEEAATVAEKIRHLLAEDKLRTWFGEIEALTDEVREFRASVTANDAEGPKNRIGVNKIENGEYRKLVDAVEGILATRAGLIQRWFRLDPPNPETAAAAFNNKLGPKIEEIKATTGNLRERTKELQARYNQLSAQSTALVGPKLREVQRRSPWLATVVDQHDGSHLQSTLAALIDLAQCSGIAERALEQLESELHTVDAAVRQAEDLVEHHKLLAQASQSMNWLKYLEKHWALAAAAGTVLVLLIVCMGRAIVLGDAALKVGSWVPFDHFSLASLPPDMISGVVGAIALALAAFFMLRRQRKADIKRLLTSSDITRRESTFLFSMNDAPPMRALLAACLFVVGVVAGLQVAAHVVLSSGARTFELSKSARENYGERCLDVHRSGTIADRIIVVRKPAQILALAPSDIVQTRSDGCKDPAQTATRAPTPGELLVALKQVTANALRMAETMARINQPVPPQLVRVETEVRHRFANRPEPAPTPDLTSIGTELAKVASAIDKLSAGQELASDVHLSYQRDAMAFANRLSFRSAELNACISRYGNDAPTWLTRRLINRDGSPLVRVCQEEIRQFKALWRQIPEPPVQIAPKSEPDEQQRASLIIASAVPTSGERAE